MDAMGRLLDEGARAAVKAARMWLEGRSRTVPTARLAAALERHGRARAVEAIRDAEEALAAGMVQAAEATFRASMALAGIEAAREAAGETETAKVGTLS